MKTFIILSLLLITTTTQGEELVYKNYTATNLCNAIYQAEGGNKAQYLYGIRSVKYKDEAEARQICINTVHNTLVKYTATRCKGFSDGLECLAGRYCPVGARNDPKGLNKNWLKNVLYFLKKGGTK